MKEMKNVSTHDLEKAYNHTTYMYIRQTTYKVCPYSRPCKWCISRQWLINQIDNYRINLQTKLHRLNSNTNEALKRKTLAGKFKDIDFMHHTIR